MAEPEIGLATVYRIIKKAGAERVSDDAADELRRILEEFAIDISRQAIELATHAGRKTVRDEDIRLAFRSLFKR